MIPAIEKEVVDKKKWLSAEELADIFGLAGSFPGAIGINSAMLIGYRIGGVAGAIAAMTGMLLPTFLVVIMLSVFTGNCTTIRKSKPPLCRSGRPS
ncbi:hypothetical protein PACILC2_30010 [Paenibacillus cisolokensis]|uniref:Chromate transporter n=1 Tax=Paenibacillus cisolokensis TaxID=1658519 RepID=A0ABQ4N842_9BACL|nr:chromate transporter [Paenibacillus cisolokensis]GIQ64433.1 hypothetical protein PACILC2_30010 [Paenibacillus cisolokensis]